MARNGECKIMADFNGHVGSLVDRLEEIHGGYGWGKQN